MSIDSPSDGFREAALELAVNALVRRDPSGVLSFSKEEIHAGVEGSNICLRKTEDGGLEIWREDIKRQ